MDASDYMAIRPWSDDSERQRRLDAEWGFCPWCGELQPCPSNGLPCPDWEPTEGPGSGDDRYRFRPGTERAA